MTETSPNRELIEVEVVYATAEKQRIISLQVIRGTTAFHAALKSGITREFTGIDLEHAPMGIFSVPLNGKNLPLPQQYVLQHRDRVEIYRPLQIDPKQARLARAERRDAASPKKQAGNSRK